jgi:TRAP-type C4-dicarboxylate transport system permease large subunit
MEAVPVLTAAHWVYAVFVLLIFVFLALKQDTSIIAILGLFIIGWITIGTPIGGLQAIFNGMVRAGIVLLDVVFIISVVVALAKGMEKIGALQLMVMPFKKLMKGPTVAFWVVGVVMLIFAVFIWPSPATALVGSVLFPAARAVGLPAISTAQAMNLFGHGVGLSGDFVIQAAPKLTAEAAGIPVGDVVAASIPLDLAASVVALAVAWFFIVRKDIKNNVVSDTEYIKFKEDSAAADQAEYCKTARVASWVVPLVFIIAVILFITLEIRGGDATAVLGGISLILLATFCMVDCQGKFSEGMERITEHVREGFQFGMKVFSPVFLVAGFYLVGVPDHAAAILGDNAAPLIVDIIKNLADVIPVNKVVVGILHTVLAGLTGLDGSGFNDLPLMGALAQSWSQALGLKTAYLAALGQISMIWIGGGTIIPWALLPVSAITGVPAMELARKNFWPCICGVTAATIVAIILM